MNFAEKVACIESALEKVRLLRRGGAVDFTEEELDLAEASLDLAAGVCKVFQERERQR